jgi:excisionase family DNA binding protein
MSHLPNSTSPLPGIVLSARADGRLLSVRDVGRALGISRTSAYALVSSGRLPAFRLGTSIRVAPESVAALLVEDVGDE